MAEQPAESQIQQRCDHICLLDADHVERGEHHMYGYEHPSPRQELHHHPHFVHMPDWQVTAARRALALARSMVLAGERMSDTAEAEINAALHYLVPYDSKRAEPEQSGRGGSDG